MAILSGKKKRSGPSSGHDFDRIKESMWGGIRGKMNKRKDVFSSDYVYTYREGEDDDIYDGETGVNKMYHRIHDQDWCNGEKNEHHAMNRFFDGIADYDDGNLVSLNDIFNDDGTIDFDSLEDFVGGE